MPSILSSVIPRNKIRSADYPNLDPNQDGAVMRSLWGEKRNISPVCLDVTTGRYHIAEHELMEITEVRSGAEVLVENTDYVVDLLAGELTLASCPLLDPATTYYLVLEADYAISATNHIAFARISPGGYAAGQMFDISGAGVWTAIPGEDMCFTLYGRRNLEDNDVLLTEYPSSWAGWGWGAPLRDNAARTRIAQSFQLPTWIAPGGDPWYLTAIKLHAYLIGAPDGDMYGRILSAYNPAEVEHGSRSYLIGGKSTAGWGPGDAVVRFPPRAGGLCDLSVDAIGKPVYGSPSLAINTLAGVLEDILLNYIGLEISKLNTPAFVDLETDKPEEITLYLEEEQEFQTVSEKMEAGAMTKIIQNLDGEIAPITFPAGIPSDTPHFFDEDFISFKIIHDYEAVKRTIKIIYDEEPDGRVINSVESNSDVALYAYGKADTAELVTLLKNQADAQALANTLSGIHESPLIIAQFEVSGAGFDLMPGDKCLITRTRACYTGGTMAAVLFCIIGLAKRKSTKTVEMTAILDSQMR